MTDDTTTATPAAPEPRPGRLAGKCAVVVGAGQTKGETLGFGRATAVLFAREGADVLLVDRDPDSVAETADMVTAEGGRASVHVMDITKEPDCATLPDAIARTLGHVDVLYNGVGIVGPGSAADITEAFWDHVMDTNLKGMWLTCKHVLPLMVARQRGSIVNVSSVGALRGVQAAYCASKAGVNSLTISMAAGYAGDNIRVNAIMPGSIDTPMAVDTYVASQGVTRAAFVEARSRRVPLAYKGSAWDIAYAALFFASDESAFTSGAILPVDGAATTMIVPAAAPQG